MKIREATNEDWDALWLIFNEIAAKGDTYVYETDTSFEQAKQIWLSSPRKTYVVEDKGEILATYYLKTNQSGPGSHICNCGYMVSSKARGKGLATAMCLHSQEIALELGYTAMQFNYVASSNVVAVHLWKKLGFQTVGVLPDSFKHPSEGLVDALVMHKVL